MKFKVFGIYINVTVLFSSTIALMLVIDRTGLITPMLVATLIHEFGHLAVMKRFGIAPKEITLKPGAINIIKPFPNLSVNHDLLISISGPAANLLMALILYLLYKTNSSRTAALWCSVQIIIAIFNLIPVSGLDGGSILYIIIRRFIDTDKAILILKIISLSVSGLLLIIGITLLVWYKSNPSLILVAIYLTIISLIKV